MPTKYDSMLQGITLKEHIDKSFLLRVINCKAIDNAQVHYTSGDSYDSLRAQLVAMYNRTSNKGVLEVTYNQADYRYGRVYPHKSISLASLERKARHALVSHTGTDTYVDVDIVNAHPTMLLQLAQYFSDPGTLVELVKHNNSTVKLCATPTQLQSYVDNRMDMWITPVMEEYGVSKDQAKTLFIIMLYLGSFATWARDAGVAVETRNELQQFQDEMRQHASFFMESANAAWYSTMCKMYPKADGESQEEAPVKRKPGRPKKVEADQPKAESQPKKKSNELGRFLSVMLQHFEMRCLETMYKYCVKHGLIINDNAVLCWDGMMLEAQYWDPSHIPAIERAIYDEVGFDLKLETKAFNQGSAIVESASVRPPTYDEQQRFTQEYFDLLELYDDQKRYFERFFALIEDQAAYIQVTRNVLDQSYSKKLQDKAQQQTTVWHGEKMVSFRHLETADFKLEFNSALGKYFVVKSYVKFTQRWCHDPSIQKYSTVNFMPTFATEDSMLTKRPNSSVFNMFMGYSGLIDRTPLPRRADGSVDEAKVLEMTASWRDVVLNLCENNPEHYDWYVKFLSQHLLAPADKTGVAIILFGDQGCGKNSHLKPISSIVGNRHFLETSKMDDIMGNHAEGIVNKLFIVLNELDQGSTLDFEGRLKDLVTSDEQRVNAKFRAPVDVDNHSCLLITSNKTNALRIDIATGNRRYGAFHSTDKYAKRSGNYSERWWEVTTKLWSSAKFIACLFYYLTKVVDGMSFKSRIPLSSGLKTMITNCTSTLQYWLGTYVADQLDKKQAVRNQRDMMQKLKDEAGEGHEFEQSRQKAIDDYNEQLERMSVFDGKSTELYPVYNRFMESFANGSKPLSVIKFQHELEDMDVGITWDKAGRINETTFDYAEVQSVMDRKFSAWKFRDQQQPQAATEEEIIEIPDY